MDWSIRLASCTDTEKLLELWETRLGSDYSDSKKLESALNENTPTTCFVAVRPERETILGFAISCVLTPREVQDKLGTNNSVEWANDRTGLLDTNCVSKSAEGQGIGTALTEKRLNNIKDRGIKTVFAVSWVRDHTRDSRMLLESAGFDCIDTHERFWYEDSLEQDYDCPDCGNPCTCTAQIYQKSI